MTLRTNIPGRQRPLKRRIAFALVEVLVSMTILGIALTAIMKSLSQSLKSARIQERQTMAMFLARQMLDEFEFTPPLPGESEGGFGDAYKYYFYRVDTRIKDPSYRDIDVPDEIDRLFAIRTYRVEILYEDEYTEPQVLLTLDSAVQNFEKFSYDTKRAYYEF